MCDIEHGHGLTYDEEDSHDMEHDFTSDEEDPYKPESEQDSSSYTDMINGIGKCGIKGGRPVKNISNSR